MEKGSSARLQEGVLFLGLEFVGAEDFETVGGLWGIEALVVALEKLEDVVDDDRLEIDLFLVVEILCLEFDLGRSGEMARRVNGMKAYRGHVDIGIWGVLSCEGGCGTKGAHGWAFPRRGQSLCTLVSSCRVPGACLGQNQ